jgi:hypothetical protein
MHKHAIAIVSLLALSGSAFGQIWPTSVILNQNVFDQCPGRFRICADLSANETQGSLVFTQADDSSAVFGLVSRGEQLTNKGNMTSVQGLGEMASYAGQSGSVDGRLGNLSAWFYAGSLYGVYGAADAATLSNFRNDSASQSLGGAFYGGSDPAGPGLFLNGVGAYYLAGTQGTLQGLLEGDLGTGAAAGVIGIDNADVASTVPTFAGWFDGDLHTTEDLTVEGRAVVNGSAAQPGYELTVNGSVWCSSGIYAGSSRRWKSDIEEIGGALDMVMDMRGVRYTHDPSGETHVGVIAEELGEVLPEAVFFEEDGQPSGVQYGRLSAVLIEAMQEQQAQIDELRAELEALRTDR